MSTTKYNPKFKTLKQCQGILDNINSSQSDKDTAKLRITEIKELLESKNQFITQCYPKMNQELSWEIQQKQQLIHSIQNEISRNESDTNDLRLKIKFIQDEIKELEKWNISSEFIHREELHKTGIKNISEKLL